MRHSYLLIAATALAGCPTSDPKPAADSDPLADLGTIDTEDLPPDDSTPPTTPKPTTTPKPACKWADHCVEVAADGTLSPPDVTVKGSESLAFLFANRWQSIIEVSKRASDVCDDHQHEVPYTSGGLTGPMPRNAGGVVVRGPTDDTPIPATVWDSPAVSAVFLPIPWETLEPKPGAYDFSIFTRALLEASKHGKLVSIGISAGSDTPDWVYDQGVPGVAMVTKATSGERCFDQTHPLFWSKPFVDLATSLENALAAELTAHAGRYRHVDKIKFSGVNFLTAETRLPVSRGLFCGFDDGTCSNGPKPAEPCVAGKCPVAGCDCYTDSSKGADLCGRSTGDLPAQWADAGYRPSVQEAYFADLFTRQAATFPDKELNLMQVARAFPSIDEKGTVLGFADPADVGRLLAQGRDALGDRFTALNAALKADKEPQDLLLEAYDRGVAQIGYQTAAPVQSWVEIEGALDNALDTLTPAGQGGAVSFVEIYLSAFEGLSAADATALEAYDERLRVRAALQRAGADPTSKPKDPEDVLPLVYVVPAGALTGQHYYKVGGLEMSVSKSTGGCDVGGVLAVP